MARQGTLAVVYIRPLDLSPDETLGAIRAAVARVGARRVGLAEPELDAVFDRLVALGYAARREQVGAVTVYQPVAHSPQ